MSGEKLEMMTSIAHSTDVIIALLMGSRGHDGGKQYEAKWIPVELAWCVLLRFLYSDCSLSAQALLSGQLRALRACSGFTQWPTQGAQSVLRSTQ